MESLLILESGDELLLESGDSFLLELQPAEFLSETLTETWAGGSIDSGKWVNWGGSPCEVQDQQLKISSTLTASFYGIESVDSYIVTGSYVTTRLVNIGSRLITSWEVYPLYIAQQDANDNQLFWWIDSNNTMRCYKKIGGINTIIASSSYNAEIHRYFKIIENSGSVFFQYSTNGVSWITLVSIPTPFDLDNCMVGQFAGTWQDEPLTTFALFDDFNIEGISITETNGYILNGVLLKNPRVFTREFIFQKTDYTMLTGKTTRDTSSRKEKFMLGYQNLSFTEASEIMSIIELNRPVRFIIGGLSVINRDTMVIPYVGAIIYDTLGGSYLSSLVLELIEEE